jgi:rfaE bifunctional protein kinase chain/domain
MGVKFDCGALSGRYRGLRVAVVGDFCLDRYLEIDATRSEVSIETGLPVRNVVHVRAQPGAAGTVLNNLSALGVGRILPVGFCGDDGEGFELRRALGSTLGVDLGAGTFLTTPERRTFTYCKPLVVSADDAPVELERLDSKNWTQTPDAVSFAMVGALESIADEVDAVVVMDQVDLEGTGVVTAPVLARLGQMAAAGKVVVADSRRGLRGYPPMCFKMNAREFGVFAGRADLGEAEVEALVQREARALGYPLVVTLAEQGMVGSTPDGASVRVPCLPVRGPIDVVGAGDSVTANLAAALGAGLSMEDALWMANAAASCVVHQLGTTGVARLEDIARLLG